MVIESIQECLQNASDILTKYGVRHILDNCKDHWSITILAQKVTLDSVEMNDLFYNGFAEFYIPLRMEYTFLGGKGCDFSMQFII